MARSWEGSRFAPSGLRTRKPMAVMHQFFDLAIAAIWAWSGGRLAHRGVERGLDVAKRLDGGGIVRASCQLGGIDVLVV